MTESQTPKSLADQLSQAEAEFQAAQARVESLRLQMSEEANGGQQQAGIADAAENQDAFAQPVEGHGEAASAADSVSSGPSATSPDSASSVQQPPASDYFAQPAPQFGQQYASFGQPTGQPYMPPQDFAQAQQTQQVPPAYQQPYQPQQPYAAQPCGQQGYWSNQQFAVPPYGGAPHGGVPVGYATKDHVAAGLLAIFLGPLGIHKFYLGYNAAGFIMLAITVIGGLLFGLGALAMCVVSLIEGILYLTKSQMEFERTYLMQERQWF